MKSVAHEILILKNMKVSAVRIFFEKGIVLKLPRTIYWNQWCDNSLILNKWKASRVGIISLANLVKKNVSPKFANWVFEVTGIWESYLRNKQ